MVTPAATMSTLPPVEASTALSAIDGAKAGQPAVHGVPQPAATRRQLAKPGNERMPPGSGAPVALTMAAVTRPSIRQWSSYLTVKLLDNQTIELSHLDVEHEVGHEAHRDRLRLVAPA